MPFVRRILPVVLLMVLALLLASCAEDSGSSAGKNMHFFGDGTTDNTEVLAKVAGVKITQKDMDLKFDEMVPRMQKRYQGDEGKRLLLKDMVDEVLLARGAQEKGLENRQEVARQMITQHRLTLVEAMRNIGVGEGREPSDEQVQVFFQDNRHEFVQEAMVRARHIECLTLERAEQAYQLLKDNYESYEFMKVAADFSVNGKTMENDADLGWFNRNGVVGYITGSYEFVAKVFDLEIGLHRPIKVEDRWHVVEILDRRPGRPMTFNEARDLARQAMLPAYYDNMVKDYLLEARKANPVEFLGPYTPGQGLDPETLMRRASAVADPGTKVDYYRLVYTDYPESDRADDALFMSALVAMDTWKDRRMAQRYLDKLIAEFPASELHEDAVFLRDNLYNPSGVTPRSIDDLKGK